MFTDILPEETINEGGLGEVISVIEKKDITTWPTWTTASTTDAQRATRTGSFTLASTKFATKINIVPDESDVETTADGGAQMLSVKNVLKFKVSGVDAAKFGFFKANKLKAMVFAYTDRSGVQYLIGDEQQGAYITKVKGSVGKNRGFEVEVTYTGKEPAIWNGTVSYAP